jgi:hypothetical protein
MRTRPIADAPAREITYPAAPPASASITLSVSNCRTRRPRPAPMASRVAISF